MVTDLDFRILGKPGRDLHARLDAMAYDDLVEELGLPDHLRTTYAESPWWAPGDARPALATDEPAVAQAMARCLVARTRSTGDPVSLVILEKAAGGRQGHVEPPAQCGWCDYPAAELQAAVGHASYMSRLIVSDIATWDGQFGSRYDRGTPRQDTYANPTWAAWFDDGDDRRAANEQRRAAIATAAAP